MIWEVTIMNKEEILAKSRQENKNRDIAEIENGKSASKFAVITSAIFAGVLFILEAVITGHNNNSLWAMLAFMNCMMCGYKAFRLGNVKMRPAAILWGFCTIIVLILAIIDFTEKSVL